MLEALQSSSTNWWTQLRPRVSHHPQWFSELPFGHWQFSDIRHLQPLTSFNFQAYEVLICGVATAGAYSSTNWNALAMQSCGWMNPLAKTPKWAMENIPLGRIMGDIVLPPKGDVLIINGASKGSQGWSQRIKLLGYSKLF